MNIYTWVYVLLHPDGHLRSSRAFAISLWIFQVVLGVFLCLIGTLKFSAPLHSVRAIVPWTPTMPPWLIRSTGAMDLLGGMGVVLPSATRILPVLTPWAALGVMTLQFSAIVFHIARGEMWVILLNGFLFVLAVLVLWGRSVGAPVASRNQ
jgi:hypothetical protein